MARKTNPIGFKWAASNTWQPARLFSVIGVGAGQEHKRSKRSGTAASVTTATDAFYGSVVQPLRE
ncbi:hypothetical protein ACFYO7_07155 [Nocardia salmonicida]|uniref:hypothetical protein n=1 Tax=Nocardia salmonicida TaxID=53431 RepID=UPI00369C59ED